MKFPRWAAWTLLGLFAIQFALPGGTARHVLCGVYAAIALSALTRNRRHTLPTLTAPFRNADEEEDRPSVPGTQQLSDAR
nr:hypothetical protein OG781_21345 [Streptomyces sp. NBC_00830]